MLAAMRGTANRLTSFPRNRLIEDDLARCRAHELDLLLALGEPTQQSPANDADPTFWWDLTWPCGIVVSLQFEQLSERLSIKADQPEVDHALFHLGIDVTDLWTLEADNPVRFSIVAAPPARVWDLWREDADGQRELVLGAMSEREARCRAEVHATHDPGHRFFIVQTAPA